VLTGGSRSGCSARWVAGGRRCYRAAGRQWTGVYQEVDGKLVGVAGSIEGGALLANSVGLDALTGRTANVS